MPGAGDRPAGEQVGFQSIPDPQQGHRALFFGHYAWPTEATVT